MRACERELRLGLRLAFTPEAKFDSVEVVERTTVQKASRRVKIVHLGRHLGARLVLFPVLLAATAGLFGALPLHGEARGDLGKSRDQDGQVAVVEQEGAAIAHSAQYHAARSIARVVCCVSVYPIFHTVQV